MASGGRTCPGGRWNAILAGAVVALLMVLGWPGPARAAGSETAAAKELAEKYSPILEIRQQEDPLCGTEGEQYQVMPVDALFGNPDVKLMRNNGKSESTLIKQGPTVDDLRNRGLGSYLDFPGNPLGDTCVYARDFNRMKQSGQAPVVVYAHISHEKGRSGLALQYWFYWYFNQFNDLHESDWEGMQIAFDADTAEEALSQEPAEMILFQHGGGERATWNESKVEKEGDHPVVYPAAGSHATFYQSAVYPQNGWNGAGVGCDNTTAPLRRLDPRPVLLPGQATDRGRFAWLSFDGRWGQKEKAFNNGPTGPQTKDQWTRPFSWMEAQRWSSPRMPGGGIIGPEAVNAFCGVMESVTGVMNLQQADPWVAYLLIAGFLVAVFLIFGYSKWRPADPGLLEQERAYGQIVLTSIRIYRRNLKEFLILGAFAIPVMGGTQALGGWLGNGAGGNGLLQTVSDVVLTFGLPAATALVSAFVIVAVRDLSREGKSGYRSSIRGTGERFWRVVVAKLLALAGTGLLLISVIGIPWAIRFTVNWSFVQQQVLFTDLSIRQSFRASSDLVRGHWWHAVRTIVPLLLLVTVAGPLLGLILIFTPLPLLLINLVGSLVYALVIPLATTGFTLLFFDLQVRNREEGVVPRRSWAPWHPSTFGRTETQPEA